VPQIDTPLLLDILLGLVILLFVPFGIRRGASKEAVVSASIFLGATLAGRFATSWGQELSHRFNLQPATATFSVSTLLFFGCAIVLGYGGGAALGGARPGLLSRLVGGLLAAFNAALILSFLLGWIDGQLRQGTVLAAGTLSAALLRQSDLLLLAGTGILMVVTVVGWIVNAMRSRRLPRETHVGSSANALARQRPVRVAASADAGKYEPEPEQIARSGRFAPGLDATSPLPAASLSKERGSWYDDGLGSGLGNGHRRGSFADESSRAAGGASSAGDTTIWAPWNPEATDTAQPKGEESGRWPVSPAVGVTDDDRCAVCHARVGPRDVFCPECGATL
jgi:uncharacterized membrane protein required for colicin V production